MGVYTFRYYDGLVWSDAMTFEQITEKIEAKIITGETWITFGSDAKLKAKDFPGLFPQQQGSLTAVGYDPNATQTVNMTREWLQSQPTTTADRIASETKSGDIHRYDNFYAMAEKLTVFLGVMICINVLIATIAGVISIAEGAVGMQLLIVVSLVNMLIWVWLFRIIITGIESFAHLVKSLHNHARKQSEHLEKLAENNGVNPPL